MIYVDAKSIISPTNNVNLYRGCSHGCIYCDTRSLCYQVKNYDEIEVKKDALLIFETELRKKKNKIVIHTGSMCDPYIHLEKDLKLTQGMLEIIKTYGHGVYILTKSDLVLRDIELFKKINQENKAIICMTLTTFDDALCRIIEPDVCVTSRRLEVLKTFADNDLLTGVWLCPILPFINDTKENIINLVAAMKAANVKFIWNFGISLTLRKGNREYYYEQLDKFFPGLKEKYIKTYGESYVIESPKEEELMKTLKQECLKHNILLEHKKIRELISKYHCNEQLTLF